MFFHNLFWPSPVFKRTVAGALAAALLVLLGACASPAPATPRAPNPDVPLADVSSLPAFPELFQQMTTLYADNPDAPKARDADERSGRGRKISIARLRKPAALEAVTAAQAQGVHGSIVVIALVDPGGRLLDARVLSSTHAELNEAVLQSARNSEYRGGRINGHPSNMYAVFGVNF